MFLHYKVVVVVAMLDLSYVHCLARGTGGSIAERAAGEGGGSACPGDGPVTGGVVIPSSHRTAVLKDERYQGLQSS